MIYTISWPTFTFLIGVAVGVLSMVWERWAAGHEDDYRPYDWDLDEVEAEQAVAYYERSQR